MNRETVIAKLREHEAELKHAGVLRLALFGSVARGDARPDSDVDLLARLDEKKRLSLFGVVRLENRLSDILGARVELSLEGLLKEPVQEQAEREAVLAF